MIRRIKFRARHETLAEQRTAGRFNPALVASYRAGSRRFRVTLAAGSSDEIAAYKAHEFVYFVTINAPLGYCGVEMCERGEKVASAFFEGCEVEDALGQDARRLSDREIAARLIAYIDERCY